ncbi:hypothetical protein B566_EDAN012220 [Ephemera danica]|nr:hypothetical protein B566_EDAN012220 [Ephemera danica]
MAILLNDAESAKIEIGPPIIPQVTFEKPRDQPKERHYDPFPPPGPHPGYPPGGPGYPPGVGGTPWASVTLDLVPGTDLTIQPGESARLTYDVTNLRDTPQPVAFAATDTLGLIRSVHPSRVMVPPRGTARTTVELIPPRPEGAEGLVNTVTLVAQAADGSNAARAALIRVTNDKEENDRWAPKCWFTVPDGQCNHHGSHGDACGVAGWSAEVTVQDDPSASCCQETMQIRVWDAAGNSRTCEAYVYGLTAAEIAVIVLAIILFLALVILIVLACLLCRGRRTVVRHDLPRRPS